MAVCPRSTSNFKSDSTPVKMVEAMTFDEYRAFVEALPYGKRLPTAIYVYRAVDCQFGDEMDRILSRLCETLGASDEFNVLKFHRNELKVSLLSYPDFFKDPQRDLPSD